jgi:hypothetical protein
MGAALGAEPSVRVTLLGKPDCSLCEAAREVVERVVAAAGEVYVERDITADPALYDAYWTDIPVVLVDGRRHAFLRVDPDRLAAALATPPPA